MRIFGYVVLFCCNLVKSVLYIVYTASLVTVQRARRGGRYGGAYRADRTIILWMCMKVGDIYSSNSELQN